MPSQRLQIVGAPVQSLHGEAQGTQIPATLVVPSGQSLMQVFYNKLVKLESYLQEVQKVGLPKQP